MRIVLVASPELSDHEIQQIKRAARTYMSVVYRYRTRLESVRRLPDGLVQANVANRHDESWKVELRRAGDSWIVIERPAQIRHGGPAGARGLWEARKRAAVNALPGGSRAAARPPAAPPARNQQGGAARRPR